MEKTEEQIFQETLLELNFEKIYETHCVATGEKYCIYARRDGLLLSYDTYRLARIKVYSIYCNWTPKIHASLEEIENVI